MIQKMGCIHRQKSKIAFYIIIMGDMVGKMVCDGVKNAGIFTLMADESKDYSKNEQFSTVFRYVDVDTGVMYERFLTFVHATSCNAVSLTCYIKEILNKYQIDPSKTVCQCYDGASVMSGCHSGVQSQVKEFAPKALYIHCYAHCINLALVDCCKSVSGGWELFSIMQSLYTFISTFKSHSIFVRVQKELHPDKQIHQLQHLSDTRWACRQGAVHAICCTFDSILETLEEIEEGTDRGNAVEASGLYQQIKNFKFILSLVIFDRLLSCSKGLSDVLQSTQLDLAKAADLASALIQTFKDFRTNESWNKVFEYAVNVAQLHSVEPVVQKKRQSKRPRRLEDAIVDTSLGHREARDATSCSEHFKVDLYYPVLDTLTSELNRHFSNKNLKILKAVQACSPHSAVFLQANSLLGHVEAYDIDADAIAIEGPLAKASFKGKTMETIGDVLCELAPLKVALPSVIKVLHIALTLAIS